MRDIVSIIQLRGIEPNIVHVEISDDEDLIDFEGGEKLVVKLKT